MNEKIKFTPIRGLEETILSIPFVNGQLYFATDTGKIYLDCLDSSGLEKNKLSVGGGGVSIIYGNDPNPIPENPDDSENINFFLSILSFETKCHIGDLILNSDGCFYKVLSINENQAYCLRLAVSGSGGGPSQPSVIDLFLEVDSSTIDQNFTYIYGANTNAIFVPKTETNDNTVTMAFTIIDNETGTENKYTIANVRKGSRQLFDMSVLPLSNDISLIVTITAMDSLMPGQSRSWVFNGLSTVSIGVKKANNNFIAAVLGNDVSGEKVLEYIPVGPTDEKNKNLVEILHVYIDGEEDNSYRTELRRGNFNAINTINISRQSHGSHTIELAVSATVNNVTKLSDRIAFDVAWATEGEDTPIIWIGDYDSTVINYENSYVHYMVYDPISSAQGLPATIQLYKDGVMLNELNLDYSTNGWAEWDISAIYTVDPGKTITTNLFSIACRGVKKDFSVDITTEGSRELGLARETALMLNFTSAGRSNLELKTARNIWKDNKGNTATLTGFNWQNNGWTKDPIKSNEVDNGTYLSLTNGASVSIPCPQITLNDDKDISIEMRFRVRNVQEYSTLVTTFPTYFYKDSEGISHTSAGEGVLLSVIESNNWEVLRDEWGNLLMDGDNTIKTVETTKGVICKWMDINNKSGFCLGSQEAFFKTDRGVINVRYKEDEVINITFVVSKTDKLVYIYLNGILSGANSLPDGATAAFTINNSFNFNSDYCDIDLFRVRVFQTGLTMPDVIHNYLSDLHSIALYDQNQLTDAMRPTELSYDLLVKYNKDNPNIPSMPYSVWEITSVADEKLPYYKDDAKKVNITFVNPALDHALDIGEIDEWFYYTHVPSFKATGVDIDVQGTSSQGYPRRNYKTKFKKAKTWVFTKGSLTGLPVSEDHTVLDRDGVEHVVKGKLHMDNEKVGVNKFTWKIDYMESSGTYNTGFANLMGNLQAPLYNKHPLDDLGISGEQLRTTVYGFPVLTFHKYSNPVNNPANITGSNNESFIYEYIGRYNMNLDKSANEAYGFEVKDPHPYIEGNPSIKNIAECWELEDNQGTWCSFKYPNDQARAQGFGTLQDGYNDRLEVMRHFEYRYSPYGDQLDAIGSDGKYDGIVDDSTEEGQAIIAEIGTTNSEKSAYVRRVYSNLERLFNWLDSTDTGAATNNAITPITWRTTKPYTGIGESSAPVYGYVAINESTIYNPEETYYIATGDNTYTVAELDEETGFLSGITYYIQSIIYYNTEFNNDTMGYRTEKFRNEFNKHLDKEYCLVYFIMTELLLCYDSRGKNMMLASWGPHEFNGDYIWYPIFYDIDTQLGLNNSGAYLWDYDADVTADGLFSTPTSVLWTNFYAVFEDDIKNKYRVLRGVNDGSKVSNNLSYENIAGAYECDPKIFNSYAMGGVRPVVAIGLDEYYKYFATTTEVGYFDTNGEKKIETSPQYAYCCQGDKKLTTELLVRNRLNYIDSWWLGGTYEINKVKQGQFWGRVNGNRIDKTSDIYIDLSAEEIAHRAALAADPNSSLTNVQRTNYEKYGRAQAATYPKAYFDSIPGFTFTPFLKEYVSYYTDEVPGVPIKYIGDESQINGIRTHVPEGTIATYKTEAESPNEQLVYIPGLDYLSSLGDLSTSYFSEFSLESGKRLLDLILGSDVPGYKNALIDANKKFELHNGANDTGKKALLQKVVMTGMTTFDKTLDMQGSGKLQEFRALRTAIPNVYFAKGVPLHTVHLPSSLVTLELIENTNLTNIITNKDIVSICSLDENGVAVYKDPSTYRGLYIEGVTDYTNDKFGTGHNLSSLVIEGGGLGFDSYKLLQNLVNLKGTATINNSLRMSLKDVVWTPYTLVEAGDIYRTLPAGQSYAKLNDHSTYDTYIYDEATWRSDVLNGLIYIYDSTLGENNPINNLTLLNQIINLYKNDSQFSGITTGNIPTITGELFVNNIVAIPEDSSIESDTNHLNYFKKYFPNLTIRAKVISESYITKYVQVLDSGKIETIDLLRNAANKALMTNEVPARTNYDFLGWSTDTTADNIIVAYNNTTKSYETTVELDNYVYPEEEKTLILYAIFEYHKHQIDFVYPDGTIVSKYITWNTPIETPNEVPYKDDKYINGSDLPLEETWRFLGWSLDPNAEIGDERITNKTFIITKDYLASHNNGIYTIWGKEPDSVYNNIHPEWFSEVDSDVATTASTCAVKLNKEVKGKLTIPLMLNGKRIIKFMKIANSDRERTNMDPNLAEVTHVFFEKDSNNRTNVTTIGEYTFRSCINLKYFEFAEGLQTIQTSAFQAVNNLILSKTISGTIVNINGNAFTYAFKFINNPEQEYPLILDGNIAFNTIGSRAFSNQNDAEESSISLQIGTEENRAADLAKGQMLFQNNASRIKEIIIWAQNPDSEIYSSADEIKTALFGNITSYNGPIIVNNNIRQA